MIDWHKELVSTLSEILPTHYEMTLHSGLQTPCISYMELSNISTDEGDSLGYSRIQYQIKVWGCLSEVQEHSQEIDKKLRPLGFKRVSGQEMYDNETGMVQKILTYEALALEEFE